MSNEAPGRREAELGRREFFKLGARRAAGVAYRLASEKIAWQSENWVRPPFARDEAAFLLACTRCDKCIEACPHDVLFRLPETLGRAVAGTPAMDLLHRGCHLCADWPCVAACEPDALRLPARGDGAPPAPVKLARARIDPETCLPYLGPECGACAAACPVPGALEWPDGIRPVIDEDLCTGCALCREACIVDPKAVLVSALEPGEEMAEAT